MKGELDLGIGWLDLGIGVGKEHTSSFLKMGKIFQRKFPVFMKNKNGVLRSPESMKNPER